MKEKDCSDTLMERGLLSVPKIHDTGFGSLLTYLDLWVLTSGVSGACSFSHFWDPPPSSPPFGLMVPTIFMKALELSSSGSQKAVEYGFL